MKPIIVFDLGGVLIDWNPRYLYRKFFTDEPHMEFFLREVVSNSWNLQMDAGKSQQESAEDLSRACPQYRDAIIAWMTRWDEMLGDAITRPPEGKKVEDEPQAAELKKTREAEKKLAELVERERELEGKVIRLTPSSLDRDFLEERGRKILNFGHDNDIVIVIQNQSKKS